MLKACRRGEDGGDGSRSECKEDKGKNEIDGPYPENSRTASPRGPVAEQRSEAEEEYQGSWLDVADPVLRTHD